MVVALVIMDRYRFVVWAFHGYFGHRYPIPTCQKKCLMLENLELGTFIATSPHLHS